MKKPLIFAFASLAAFALADGLLVSSTGKGGATTSDGRVGSFDYAVSKRTASNGAVKFEGRLRFEQRPNDHGRYVLIEMGAPDGLGLGANPSVCEFGGRGVLVLIVEGRRVNYGGRVSVRVVDNRNEAHPAGDPDAFRIRFTGERGLTFAFEGRVDRGDLIVTSRIVR